MGFFKVKPEYEETTRPVKHIREDGKVLWQPRLRYTTGDLEVEDRYKSTNKHGSHEMYESCHWFLEGFHSGAFIYPKLYPWKWYARKKAWWRYKEYIRQNIVEERSRKYNTREVDE